MKARKKRENGVSLTVLLLVVMVLGIGAISVGKLFSISMKNATSERQKQVSIESASSSLMDYMRMFSNSFYDKHYDNLNLIRPDLKVGSGSVSYVPTSSATAHTVYLESTGKFGSGLLPGMHQKFSALIRFQSDLTRFSTFLPNDFTVTQNGVSYGGVVYFRNDFTIGASGVSFLDTLVVAGDLNLGTNNLTVGNLYLGGNKTGSGTLTLVGKRYNFAPTIDPPVIDLNYYNLHYTTKTTVFVWWKFNANGTYQACYSAQSAAGFSGCTWTSPIAVPPEGGIFYGENINVGAYGTVGARATVVAGGNPPSAAAGNILIPADVTYVGGTDNAGPDHSIAFLAKNRVIIKNWDNGDAIVHGLIYPEGGKNDGNYTGTDVENLYNGGSNRYYRFWGSRVYGNSFSSPNAGPVLTADPFLNAYPPPGLPEKPLLVNVDMQ